MNHTVRTHAVLIAGDSRGFKREAKQFERVLQLSDTSVTIVANCEPAECLATIVSVLSTATEHDVVLIGFCGHGSVAGWQTSTKPLLLTFDAMIAALAHFEHTMIQFCASTCYAQHLIKALIGCRSMFTTSVLVPSAFGDNTFVGNAFVDISKAWAKGRFAVDSRVGYREHTKHFATAYAQTLQHWGVLFDHYFFPRDAKSPS